MQQSVYLDLDGAWGTTPLNLPVRNAQTWGPRLRYIARKREIEEFYLDISSDLAKFVLYGSGDFHHLAGMLIRRIEQEPFILISFDNHPDWDVRPPNWSCGGWAARTLRTGRVERVSVWGCGNFELTWPSRMFADWSAIRAGKFEIHPWAERHSSVVRKRFDCMSRENWRQRFEHFAASLGGKSVYVTVDMDCLRAEEAVTNWENGLFTADDLVWALGLLRSRATLVGGDVCGAASPAEYARPSQRLAAGWDHPKLPPIDAAEALKVNTHSLEKLWRALCG